MNEQLNFWSAAITKCECGKDTEFCYKGNQYCCSCMIKKLKIKVVDYIKYYKDGNFLGCANYKMIEIFNKIDSSITCKE